jgi:hypothetical protein
VLVVWLFVMMVSSRAPSVPSYTRAEGRSHFRYVILNGLRSIISRRGTNSGDRWELSPVLHVAVRNG